VSEHPSSSDAVQRVVVWRSLFAEGTDYCALWRTQNGWALRGTAISLPRQGNPILAHYHVHCDAAWQTQRVDVERVLDGRAEAMHFIMESAGMWRSGNRELLSIAGCVDVDLAITPATNTLPIRRLNIPTGESREVTAAWIKFPELEIEPLPQRYTRLSELTYRYESGSNFSTEVVVDEAGLVITYRDGWARIATR
jgi:uncharacterized protein